MCCNADVLFSVLVLHWVTSKDKASTASSHDQYSAQNTSNAQRNKNSAGSMGPYSVVDKLGVFDATASKAREGTVTTHISAQELKDMKLEETDLDSKGRPSSIPLGKIKVQVGRVVQVESRPRGTSPTGKSEMGEDIAEVRRVSQGGSGRSTEKLVEERIPQSWLGGGT